MHADGNGLYLRVTGAARSWILRYKKGGKAHDIGLGSLSLVPLAKAREKSLALRAGLLDGKTPQRQRRSADERANTFATVVAAAVEHQANIKKWKNAKHAAQWSSTLEAYAVGKLGGRIIGDLTRDDVLAVLKPIWYDKNETARRVQQRLRVVFDYAIARGLYSGSNPAEWRGNLASFLPPPSAVQDVSHHDAMNWKEVPALFKRLRASQSISARAIEFGILTATRAQEFCLAQWDEFELDGDAPVWLMPPERRKDKKPYPHRVPLAAEVVELLRALPRLGVYVFPGKKENKPISKETPRILLQKDFGAAVTMHGFRSTFRDWGAEQGKDFVLMEKALCHSTGNEVSAAYQRSDLLEQRRPVMADWAAWCLRGKADE